MTFKSYKFLLLAALLGLGACSPGTGILSGKSTVPDSAGVQTGNKLAVPPDLQLPPPGQTTDAYQPNGYVPQVPQAPQVPQVPAAPQYPQQYQQQVQQQIPQAPNAALPQGKVLVPPSMPQAGMQQPSTMIPQVPAGPQGLYGGQVPQVPAQPMPNMPQTIPPQVPSGLYGSAAPQMGAQVYPAANGQPVPVTLYNNAYVGLAAPDVYQRYGVSRFRKNGQLKTLQELKEDLRKAVLAKKRQENPNYGTISNFSNVTNGKDTFIMQP